MSIFSKPFKVLGNLVNKIAPVATVASLAVPGAGVVARTAGIASTALRALPGAGKVAAGVAGAALTGASLGSLVAPSATPHKKRRRRGISASELKGFRRVARVLNKYFHETPRAMKKHHK